MSSIEPTNRASTPPSVDHSESDYSSDGSEFTDNSSDSPQVPDESLPLDHDEWYDYLDKNTRKALKLKQAAKAGISANNKEHSSSECIEKLSQNTDIGEAKASETEHRFLTPTSQQQGRGSFPVTPCSTPLSDTSPKVIVKFTDIRSGLGKAALSTCVDGANIYLKSPKHINFKDITKTLCSPSPASQFKRPQSRRKPDVRPGSSSTKAVRKMNFAPSAAEAKVPSPDSKELAALEEQEGIVSLDLIAEHNNMEDCVLETESVANAINKLRELSTPVLRRRGSTNDGKPYVPQDDVEEEDNSELQKQANLQNQDLKAMQDENTITDSCTVTGQASSDTGTKVVHSSQYEKPGFLNNTLYSVEIPVGHQMPVPNYAAPSVSSSFSIAGNPSVYNMPRTQGQNVPFSRFSNLFESSFVPVYTRPYPCSSSQADMFQPVYSTLQPRTFHPRQFPTKTFQPPVASATCNYFVPIQKESSENVAEKGTPCQSGTSHGGFGKASDFSIGSPRTAEKKPHEVQQGENREKQDPKIDCNNVSKESAGIKEHQCPPDLNNNRPIESPQNSSSKVTVGNEGWLSPQPSTSGLAERSFDPMLSGTSFEETPKRMQTRSQSRRSNFHGSRKRRLRVKRRSGKKTKKIETQAEVGETLLAPLQSDQGYELVEDTDWNAEDHENDGVLSASNIDEFAKNQPASVLLSGAKICSPEPSPAPAKPLLERPRSPPPVQRITSPPQVKKPMLHALLTQSKPILPTDSSKATGTNSEPDGQQRSSSTSPSERGKFASSECRNPKKEMIERQMMEERAAVDAERYTHVIPEDVVEIIESPEDQKVQKDLLAVQTDHNVQEEDVSIMEVGADSAVNIPEVSTSTHQATVSINPVVSSSSWTNPQYLCSMAARMMDKNSLEKLVEYQAQYISVLQQGMQQASYMQPNIYCQYPQQAVQPTAVQPLPPSQPYVLQTVPNAAQNVWMPAQAMSTVNQQAVPVTMTQWGGSVYTQPTVINAQPIPATYLPMNPVPAGQNQLQGLGPNYTIVNSMPSSLPTPHSYQLPNDSASTDISLNPLQYQAQSCTTLPHTITKAEEVIASSLVSESENCVGQETVTSDLTNPAPITYDTTASEDVHTDGDLASEQADVEGTAPQSSDSVLPGMLQNLAGVQECSVITEPHNPPAAAAATTSKGPCPKPKHFVLCSLSIGTFQYEATGNMAPKLKIIFSRKRVIYEMEWASCVVTCAGSGRARVFACIEVPFTSIVGLCAQADDQLVLEVKDKPAMYIGSRPCDENGKYIRHKVVSYNRSRSTDFTSDQMSTIPYHTLHLLQPYAHRVVDALVSYDPDYFSTCVHVSLVQDPCKRLSDSGVASVRLNLPPHTAPQASTSTHTLSAAATTTLTQGSKPQCCCMSGCASMRCGCVARREPCSATCSCHKVHHNCSNPINVLYTACEGSGVSLAQIRADPCLMANIYKMSGSISEYLHKSVVLSCCGVSVRLTQCVPGRVSCPSGCVCVYMYSWCTGKLHEENSSPRNHCEACETCMAPDTRHCQVCDRCYTPEPGRLGGCPCHGDSGKQEEEVTSTCMADASRVHTEPEEQQSADIHWNTESVPNVGGNVQHYDSTPTSITTAYSTVSSSKSTGQDHKGHQYLPPLALGDTYTGHRMGKKDYSSQLQMHTMSTGSNHWSTDNTDDVMMVERGQDRPHSTLSAAAQGGPSTVPPPAGGYWGSQVVQNAGLAGAAMAAASYTNYQPLFTVTQPNTVPTTQ